MMGWCQGMDGGWMLLGGLVFLFFVGGLIVSGVIVFAALARSNSKRHRNDSGLTTSVNRNAVEILKERYARGEITKEEYQNVLDDLTRG